MARLPLLTLAELAERRGAVVGPDRLGAVWEAGAFAIGAAPGAGQSSPAPPFAAVRRLFDMCDAAMAAGARRPARLGPSVPGGPRPPRPPACFWRGLVCPEGREQLGAGGADRKRSIDLTPEALASRRLSRRLGGELEELQRFFGAVEAGESSLVPLLSAGLDRCFGLPPSVLAGGRMHRLLDYREELLDSPGPRCRPHCDFGSFTLLWGDGPGLEVQRPNRTWAEAPPGAEVVVVAGAALSLTTAGRVFAPPHRVVAPPGPGIFASERAYPAAPRRAAIALFVEPAKAQVLDFAGPNLRSGLGTSAEAPRLTYAELKRRVRHQPGVAPPGSVEGLFGRL